MADFFRRSPAAAIRGRGARLARFVGISQLPLCPGARRRTRAARSVLCARASPRPRGDRRAWRRGPRRAPPHRFHVDRVGSFVYLLAGHCRVTFYNNFTIQAACRLRGRSLSKAVFYQTLRVGNQWRQSKRAAGSSPCIKRGPRCDVANVRRMRQTQRARAKFGKPVLIPPDASNANVKDKPPIRHRRDSSLRDDHTHREQGS